MLALNYFCGDKNKKLLVSLNADIANLFSQNKNISDEKYKITTGH